MKLELGSISDAAAGNEEGGLAHGIRQLFSRGTLCDVTLVAGNREFAAHRVVLASASSILCDFIENADADAAAAARVALVAPAVNPAVSDAALEVEAPVDPAGPQRDDAACVSEITAPTDAVVKPDDEKQQAAGPVAEASPCDGTVQEVHPEVGLEVSEHCLAKELRFPGVSCPDAVSAMLDYIYELGDDYHSGKDYCPPSDESNIEVLRLARQFDLQPLLQRALRYLTRDLSTLNVVQRLAVCEEFDLVELREKIITKLAHDQKALVAVSSNMEIVKHPSLLQGLLVQVASSFNESEVGQAKPASSPPAKKRAASPPAKEQAAKRGRRASVGGA